MKSLELHSAVWGGLLAPPPLSSRVDLWRRAPPGSHILSPGSLELRAEASSLSPSVAGIETGVAGGPWSSDYLSETPSAAFCPSPQVWPSSRPRRNCAFWMDRRLRRWVLFVSQENKMFTLRPEY